MRKIKLCDIKVRKPYYIECNLCHKTAESDSADFLLKHCKNWNFNNGLNIIICDECYMILFGGKNE